jgi:predicted unusual protein kinase regulating ubiquinone biosynthesis (AarF/ABC1/UbiB family)
VAIKVQRPDILGRVALDMHLLRILSGPIKALAGLQTDLAGVIDDWYVAMLQPHYFLHL